MHTHSLDHVYVVVHGSKIREFRSGERLLLSVPYRPQMTEAPLSASVAASDVGPAGVSVVAVDTAG